MFMGYFALYRETLSESADKKKLDNTQTDYTYTERVRYREEAGQIYHLKDGLANLFILHSSFNNKGGEVIDGLSI